MAEQHFTMILALHHRTLGAKGPTNIDDRLRLPVLPPRRPRNRKCGCPGSRARPPSWLWRRRRWASERASVRERRCSSGRGFPSRRSRGQSSRWAAGPVLDMAASVVIDGVERRGCEHYERGCILKAPCCEKFYTCRLCHDRQEDHQLDRFKVKEVQCINCEKIQHAQQTCEECSTLFGEYYCSICHLFDKDKKQYHCEKCGICRIGPKEDFFHCLKCNLCLAINLQGKHKCIENVSRQNCPICLEDIHTSRVVAHVLPCGHLLHRICYEEMLKEGYRCPLCMHSALDMSRYWRQLDDEVAQTPMPSEYQNMTVDILCNDCNGRSTVQFHILGMKCSICESYNTAQTGGCRISLDQQ